jgi:hypothetical protein
MSAFDLKRTSARHCIPLTNKQTHYGRRRPIKCGISGCNCEINDLGEQIGEADQKMDDNKAEALSRQVTELEKKLGPEYSALVNDLNNVDPNSPQSREIDSILAPLDDSCD